MQFCGCIESPLFVDFALKLAAQCAGLVTVQAAGPFAQVLYQ
jgi:hypothetical protein